jgi:hypothetical protein
MGPRTGDLRKRTEAGDIPMTDMRALTERLRDRPFAIVSVNVEPGKDVRELKEAWEAVRAECDPKFKDYAIYEHCLPFNVARAYDEARGIDTPRIWTAERDRQMWDMLQN